MEQENRVRMERIAADPQSGLSAEQVKRRFAQGENNYKVESSTLSVSEIVRSNVCTYFNLVFAVIAVLLAIVGAWSDMLFLPIIVANTCIGIIQEVHSKKVLDKLSILNAPHAVVIRDGKRQEIPADQLVLDDIVEFSAGSQIPADAKVVSGELQVNESLITGESDEIEKRPTVTSLRHYFPTPSRRFRPAGHVRPAWRRLSSVALHAVFSLLLR